MKNKKNYSHWGYISLAGDNYATGKERDILNEGSSSRLYSFNIYLKFDVVYYNTLSCEILENILLREGEPVVLGQ